LMRGWPVIFSTERMKPLDSGPISPLANEKIGWVSAIGGELCKTGLFGLSGTYIKIIADGQF